MAQTGEKVATDADRDESPDSTQTPQVGEPIMTMEEYLRTARTLTEAQVARNESLHDVDDLAPAERLPFDTGSMHTLETS